MLDTGVCRSNAKPWGEASLPTPRPDVRPVNVSENGSSMSRKRCPAVADGVENWRGKQLPPGVSPVEALVVSKYYHGAQPEPITSDELDDIRYILQHEPEPSWVHSSPSWVHSSHGLPPLPPLQTTTAGDMRPDRVALSSAHNLRGNGRDHAPTGGAMPGMKPPHPFRALCEPGFARRPYSARGLQPVAQAVPSRGGEESSRRRSPAPNPEVALRPYSARGLQPVAPPMPSRGGAQSSKCACHTSNPRGPRSGSAPAGRRSTSKDALEYDKADTKQTRVRAAPTGLEPTVQSLEDAGIDSAVASIISIRLAQLSTARPDVLVWILVDTCRDCASHNQYVRHDERMYVARFLQLKDAVQQLFSQRQGHAICVQVENLVDPHAISANASNAITCGATALGSAVCSGVEKRCGSANTLRVVASSGGHVQIIPRRDPCCGQSPESSVRIGAFEVYMCCREPLVLDGGAVLPIAKRGCTASLNEGISSRALPFQALCLASKIRTRLWPAPEIVLNRIVAHTPCGPFRVEVKTEYGLAVSGVQVQVTHAHDHALDDKCELEDTESFSGISAVTDEEGVCDLVVPICSKLRVVASHPLLMKPQVRTLYVNTMNAVECLRADTVIQLWQAVDGKELVVYRCSPRLNQGTPSDVVGLELFQGELETVHGTSIKPDCNGCIRAQGNPIAEVDVVSCSGWRPGKVTLQHQDLSPNVEIGFLELARLQVPIVEVSMIASCCGSLISGARVHVDGEYFGTTQGSGLPVACGVRLGQHSLRLQHEFCISGAIEQPLSIRDFTTRPVEVELPIEGFQFVCAARPITSNMKSVLADLYLVGGDLKTWRSGSSAPPKDAKLWLWDGELHGMKSANFTVQDGRLLRPPTLPLSYCGGNSQFDDSGSFGVKECDLSCAINKLASSKGPWRVAFSRISSRGTCVVQQLAQAAANDAPPALWLGRLQTVLQNFKKSAPSPPPSPLASPRSPILHVKVKGTCCCCGFANQQVEYQSHADNSELIVGSTNEYGQVELCCGAPIRNRKQDIETQGTLHIKDVAPCLLPGGSTEYCVYVRSSEATYVELDVSCSIWICWAFDEDDDEDFYDDEEADEAVSTFENRPPPGGMLWICTSEDMMPDCAHPVKGMLHCPGAEQPEIYLDGHGIRPVLLRSASASPNGAACLLAGLDVRPEPPDGYYYRPKEPSPLAQRCVEEGGCELQRLTGPMACAQALGFFSPLQANSQ